MSDSSESLKKFGLLCQQVTAEPSLTIKEELIRGFINRYTGDLGLLLKLLLPKYAKRVFYTQEKQLLRVLSTVLTVAEDDLKNEWNRNGCIAETAQRYFKPTAPLDHNGWCQMTLERFDSFLVQMETASTEVLRVGVVHAFMKEACSNAVYLFFRELKLDLRLGAGLRVVLKGLHPSAYEIFQHCADIQEVARRVRARGSTQSLPENDPLDDGAEAAPATITKAAQPPPQAVAAAAAAPKRATGAVKNGAVSAQIKLGMPLAPMLAAPAKTVDQVLAKCPNGAFSEVKYDGERIQIHKHGDSLSCFARSLRPMQPDKYAGLEPFLHKAIKADECILDGEILMVDIQTSTPLPFGTLGKHKRTQFATACPCVFLFDILYKDGASLLQRPLKERREELKAAVDFTRNRVMFSELCHVTGDTAQRRAILQQHLNRAIAEGLEGLVVKDLLSVYTPRSRHWLKIKKDYLDGLADSADLIVLGAWYGSGSKGGLLSTFLMGCVDASVPAGQPGRYKTVCKVGNGLDDVAITVLSRKYTGSMSPVSRGAPPPPWMACHSSHLPDMIVNDPAAADVMEIIGAEFSVTRTHTAGISIRFPRILRIRTDKNTPAATTLQEVLQLYRTSKERLTSAGVPATLQLVDSYVVPPPAAGDDDGSNLTAPRSPQPAAASEASRDAAEPPVAGGGLTYTKGDATQPDVPDTESVVLCHSSAVGGAWSQRGFMGQVSRVLGDTAALAYAQSVGHRSLGDVIVTEVGSTARAGRVYVATMMAQSTAPRGETPPVDDGALRTGLMRCLRHAAQNGASLHIVRPPDSTKADWAAADEMLQREAAAQQVRVVVYGAEPIRRRPSTPPPTPSSAIAPQHQPAKAAPMPCTDTAAAAGPQPARSGPPSPPLIATAARESCSRRSAASEAQEAPRGGEGVVEAGPHGGGAASAAPQEFCLPRLWWSLLHDVRAQLVGPDPGERFRGIVAMLGGRVVHSGAAVNGGERCTHVVLLGGAAAGPTPRDNPPPSAALVTGRWLEDCVRFHTRFAEDLYNPSRLSVLDDCRVVLSPALGRRAELQRLAALLGAAEDGAWQLTGSRSTHYISDVWDDAAETVFRLGGRVVRSPWLIDCAAAQTVLPARPYLLQRASSRKSGGGASANPLEGLLCGLKVHLPTAPGSDADPLTLAAREAVRQMGGVVVADAADAQYCVMTSDAFARASADGAPALSAAVRFRCLSPDWLWETAQRRSLQDPTAYIHLHRGAPPQPTAPTTTAEAEDARSCSSYSTATYVEDEAEEQVSRTPPDDLTDADDADAAEPPRKLRRS